MIKSWDLRADSTNTSAALAILALPNAFKIEDLKYHLDSVTVKLRETISYLEKEFGRIDIPLGRVQRLVRGKTNLPLSGGPGTSEPFIVKRKKIFIRRSLETVIYKLWSGDLKVSLMHGVSTNMEVQLKMIHHLIMMISRTYFPNRK